MTSLSLGTVFHDDYRIERKLSEGGMGAVFVASQISTGATRALKVMKPELVENPELRKRFELEAKVASRIPSDHVVQVISAGVDAGTGAPFLVMELLEGETLSDAVESKGPFDLARLERTLRELCHALGAAHDANIVHRDLKPDNVFLAQSLRAGGEPIVKVLDFGIAKIVDEARTSETTAAIGTPTWMAPEQTDRKGMISAATDVWALGLIAYFLLTGRSYWLGASSGSVAVLFREILFDPIVPASERARDQGASPVPAWFDPWFAGCVARDPSKRFRDARATFDSFAAGASGRAPQQVGVHPPTAPSLPVQDPTDVARFPLTHQPTVLGTPVSGVIKPSRRKLFVTIASVVLGVACVVGVRLGVSKLTAKDRGCTGLDPSACVARCDEGSGPACFDLADRYERGSNDMPKDAALARKAYGDACKDGVERACGAYAELLVVDGQDQEARTYAATSCVKEDERGCYALGVLKLRVEELRDEDDAARHFEAACERKHDRACTARGDLALARKEPAALRKSFYERACGRRWGEACVRMAEQSLRGVDGLADPNEARTHAKAGCVAGSARACGIEGALEIAPRPTDAADAMKALETGCSTTQRDGVACERLAFLLDRGWGTTRDEARAEQLYRSVRCGEPSDRELTAACARAATRSGRTAVASNVGSQLLREGCDGGDPWGCLYAGDASSTDTSKRAQFYDAACAKAETADPLDPTARVACAEVDQRKGAAELAAGKRKEALALFDRACKAGAGSGCLASAAALHAEQQKNNQRHVDVAGVDRACDDACKVARMTAIEQGYFSACDAASPALEACVLGGDVAAQRGTQRPAYVYEKLRSACRRGHEPTCKVLDDRKIAR